MSTDDAQFKPPRKKPGILWWIGGGFLLLFCLFLYQLFGPNPPIVVSKQTTYVTSPLKKDGMPDYVAYYRKVRSEGVTPENNAAALLFTAICSSDLNSNQLAVLAERLALTKSPTPATSLRPLQGVPNRKRVAAWLHKQGRLKLPGQVVSEESIQQVLKMQPLPLSDEAEKLDFEVVGGEIDLAGRWPWTESQIPPLAAWVRENRPYLDSIVAASQRPHFFVPSLTTTDDPQELLISTALPEIQSEREAARALSVRAMWHLGEGRALEAWQDVLAIHRLARLMEQNTTIVGQLVAHAISRIASDHTTTILSEGHLTTELAQQIHRDLESLPYFSLTTAFDKGDRIITLDYVLQCASVDDIREVLGKEVADSDGSLSMLNAVSIDWNIVLGDMNVIYDELVAAAACPTREQRRVGLLTIESEIAEAQAQLHSPSSILTAAFDIQRRSKLASGVVFSLLSPSLVPTVNSQDMANTQFCLARVAAALALYNAKHGTYPETLGAVARDLGTKLPVDPYSDKSFIYVPLKNGYLLYSVAANGNDEHGSNAMWRVYQGIWEDELAFPTPPPDIPQDSDDLSVRIPRSPHRPINSPPPQTP